MAMMANKGEKATKQNAAMMQSVNLFIILSLSIFDFSRQCDMENGIDAHI